MNDVQPPPRHNSWARPDGQIEFEAVVQHVHEICTRQGARWAFLDVASDFGPTRVAIFPALYATVPDGVLEAGRTLRLIGTLHGDPRSPVPGGDHDVRAFVVIAV